MDSQVQIKMKDEAVRNIYDEYFNVGEMGQKVRERLISKGAKNLTVSLTVKKGIKDGKTHGL